ncbi:hypothetical protein V5799_019739 [Amblyomma americanum]|uniref:Secreted protein n=1 Tax=Amblyomma americanum TaxID=6943 RepID=A0AAQ4EW23_AMBAM
MLWLVVMFGLAAQGLSSASSLPRCSDAVCAQDPHCIYARSRTTCWDVTGSSTATSCRCCQNCITGGFISEDCARQAQACVLADCPKVKCPYGSYVPDCDCCNNCLPQGTRCRLLWLLSGRHSDCNRSSGGVVRML